jgi:hypothetical protein
MSEDQRFTIPVRCNSGKHELTVLKAKCPFCEIERLRALLGAVCAENARLMNLCVGNARLIERGDEWHGWGWSVGYGLSGGFTFPTRVK